jgi:hypothetical protein
MTDQIFSFGIGYWPRRRAGAELPPNSWSEVDAGGLREDLAHIAELGFDTLTVDLRWEESQPAPSTINGAALRGLERAMDAAVDRGLRLSIGLLGGSFADTLHLPRWACGLRVDDLWRASRYQRPLLVDDDGPTLLSDGRYHREPPRDLYGDALLREAERYQLREVLGYFAQHPAAWQWRIGDGLQRIVQAQSDSAARTWWATLAELARGLGAQSIAASHDMFTLSRSDSARPAALAADGSVTLINVRPDYPVQVRRPWSPDYIVTLYALVERMLAAERSTYAKPIVSGIGLPSAEQAAWLPGINYGEVVSQYYGDAEQQAHFLGETLVALHRAGAGGAWLSDFADPPRSLWEFAPLDRAQPWRRMGLLDHEGREKAAAAVVRRTIAALRAEDDGGVRTAPAIDLDPERYWHDPTHTLQRLINTP